MREMKALACALVCGVQGGGHALFALVLEYRWPNGLGPVGRTRHDTKKPDPNLAQPMNNKVSANPIRWIG